jgi:hypothetical protein
MCKSFVLFLVGLLFSILPLANVEAEEMHVPLRLKIDNEERETSAKLVFQWHWYDKPESDAVEVIKRRVHEATAELTSAIRENNEELYKKLSENSWKCEELPSSGGLTLAELRAGNETFPEIKTIGIVRIGEINLNYYSVTQNSKTHFTVGFPIVMEGSEARYCSQFYKTTLFRVISNSLYSMESPIVPTSGSLPGDAIKLPLLTCGTLEDSKPRIELTGGRIEDSAEYESVLKFCVEAETLRNKSFSALSLQDDSMNQYLKVLTQASQESISLLVAKDGLEAWNKSRNRSVMIDPSASLVLELGDAYLVVSRVEGIAGQKELHYRCVLKSGDGYNLASAETHTPIEGFLNLDHVREVLETALDKSSSE